MKWQTLLVLGVCLGRGFSNNLFNIDNPVILKAGQTGIEFGYSIALFTNGSHRNLLVGAPLANTTQQGVSSPGALYSCDLLSKKLSVQCSQLAVDTRNAKDKYVPFIDEDLKDHQRLGGSLSSRNNNILVCAPNWHYYERRISLTIDGPTGICFKGSSLDSFSAFSVPYDTYTGHVIDYLNVGSCQSGFSSALSKKNEAVLGSPGCYNWEGDVFAEVDSQFVSFGKGFTSNDLGAEEEGEEIWLSNMYMGYSVGEGEFAGAAGIAVGMPRSAHLNKKINTPSNPSLLVANPMVPIFLLGGKKLKLWTKLKPPQNDEGHYDAVWLFSYFGYSLTVADIDGDGLDDVIVGAPFYHNETSSDQGAILVYMQKENGGREDSISKNMMFSEKDIPLRVGEEENGRFGSCLSNVGDLNGDTIHDVAVGAPYAGAGRVYIYLGSKDGLSSSPFQILQPSDQGLFGHNLIGFGSSFAPNFQMKEGPQNDLAIGSFLSDTVVILRTKVMIDVEWEASFTSKMDLRSECLIKKKKFPCTEIVTCLSYTFLETGKQGDSRPKEHSLSYSLDIDNYSPRLFFDDFQPRRTISVFVEFQRMTCHTEVIYTTRELYNLDAFKIKTDLTHIPRNFDDQSRLQTTQKMSSTDVLEILFECESLNVSECVSDLHMEVKTTPSSVFVEEATFSVEYELTNFGESSYSNQLKIETDSFLEISGKAEIVSGSTVSPTIDCQSLEPGIIRCSLGTFIRSNDVLKFRVTMVTTNFFLDLANLRERKPQFAINSSVETLSDIKYPQAATKMAYVELEANPIVFLTKNEPSTDLVTYEDTQYEYLRDTDELVLIGPEIIHTYEIYNVMSYVIEDNLLSIFWPFKLNDIILLDGNVSLTSYSEGCQTDLRTGYVKGDVKNMSSFGDVIWKVTTCKISFLQPQKSVEVSLDLRLNMKTLIEEVYDPEFDEIRSYVKLESIPVLLGKEQKSVITNEIKTSISYGDFVFQLVPKWVYVLGIVLGLVLMVLVVVCLRRLNFFKRKNTDKISQENLADEERNEGTANEADAMVSAAQSNEEIYDNI